MALERKSSLELRKTEDEVDRTPEEQAEMEKWLSATAQEARQRAMLNHSFLPRRTPSDTGAPSQTYP